MNSSEYTCDNDDCSDSSKAQLDVDAPQILSFKVRELGESLKKAELELVKAKANLRMVSAGAENVWFWEEGGSNNPESISCPVVMSAETLRRLLAKS